jgi:hypothetical protein
VVIRGSTEKGNQLWVTITGTTTAEPFNKKGRLGPFWANVGKITVTGVPSLHLIASEGPPAKAPHRVLTDKYLLDLDALRRQIKIDPADPDLTMVQNEYLKLKQSQGRFALFEGAVKKSQGTYEARFPWPDSVPTGTYQIQVYHVRQQQLQRIESQELKVELVGFPRFIAYMAFERGALYGMLSVVIALGVGFIMGLVFKKKGAGGH